jgi:MFS transporter, DHA1 family, inner membrane transport protein
VHRKPVMVVVVGVLGAAAFATGSPLQMWVLRKAEGAQNLASSLNIGAFNLGNAFGAWLGSVAIAHGAGLPALTWIAALVPGAALLVTLVAIRPEPGLPSAAQPEAA